MERIKEGEIFRSCVDGECYRVESTRPNETRVLKMAEDRSGRDTLTTREMSPDGIPLIKTGDIKVMNDQDLEIWFNRRSPGKHEWAMEKLAWDLRQGDVMRSLFDGEHYKIQEMDSESITVAKVKEEKYTDGTIRYAKIDGKPPMSVKGDDIRSYFDFRGPGRQRQMEEIEGRPAGSPHIAAYVRSIPLESQYPEAMRIAAEKSPASVLYMRGDIQKAFLPDAISKDPTIIKDISRPHKGLQYRAVEANPFTVYLIDNPDPGVIKNAGERIDFNGIGITKLRNFMNQEERDAAAMKKTAELAAGRGVKFPSRGVDRNLLRMTSREVLPKADITAKLKAADIKRMENEKPSAPGSGTQDGPGSDR